MHVAATRVGRICVGGGAIDEHERVGEVVGHRGWSGGLCRGTVVLNGAEGGGAARSIANRDLVDRPVEAVNAGLHPPVVQGLEAAAAVGCHHLLLEGLALLLQRSEGRPGFGRVGLGQFRGGACVLGGLAQLGVCRLELGGLSLHLGHRVPGGGKLGLGVALGLNPLGVGTNGHHPTDDQHHACDQRRDAPPVGRWVVRLGDRIAVGCGQIVGLTCGLRGLRKGTVDVHLVGCGAHRGVTGGGGGWSHETSAWGRRWWHVAIRAASRDAILAVMVREMKQGRRGSRYVPKEGCLLRCPGEQLC